MGDRRIRIRTTDLRYARPFYERLFECRLYERDDGTLSFEAGALTVELQEGPVTVRIDRRPRQHETGLTICIDDLAAMKLVLAAKNILFRDHGPDLLKVHDPDGNIINVRRAAPT